MQGFGIVLIARPLGSCMDCRDTGGGGGGGGGEADTAVTLRELRFASRSLL